MDNNQFTRGRHDLEEVVRGAADVGNTVWTELGRGIVLGFVLLALLAIVVPSGILSRTLDGGSGSRSANSIAAPPPAVAAAAGHTPHAAGAQAFVAAMLPYARQAAPVVHWPVSLILAQWMIETGKTVPTANGYNVGNVRSFPGCREVQTAHNGQFCYADTIEEGLREYEGTALNGRYTRVSPAAAYGAAHGGIVAGAQDAARALGASPWDAGRYTSINVPGSSLIGVLNQFDLYRYDQ